MVGTVAMRADKLEEIIKYLKNPGLIVLAARPNMGKTTLAMNIAKYTLEQYGEKTIIFSTFFSEQQLYHKYNIQDKSNITIIDEPFLKISQIKENLKYMNSSDLVIIDYLQLLDYEPEKQNRKKRYTDVVKSLKKISQELSVPVLLLSQLYRGVDNRKNHHPVLEDIIEFDVEQEVDTIMFLYRDAYYKEGYEAFDPILECSITAKKTEQAKRVLLNCYLNFIETDTSDL